MAEAKVKRSKKIFLFLRIAVVVCGIALGVHWVSQGQRWANLKQIFAEMNLWLFAGALGIFVFCQMLIGLRWWVLLKTQSIFIPLLAAVRLHFLGTFYNNFMPGSVGGDLVRAWYVKKHSDKWFQAALSVFVDRVVGLVSTLVIAVFFYILFLRGRGLRFTAGGRGFIDSAAKYKWIFLGAALGAAAILALLSSHNKGRKLLAKCWLRIRTLGIKLTKKLKDSIVLYYRKPLSILTAFCLTVFLQMVTITGFWFLGVNLGVDVSLKFYYVFFTLTWVLGAVPVTIGGAGVVEVLLASLFIKFAGVGEEAALALALCQRAIWMIASLPGAAIHLLGAHLPGETKPDKIQLEEAKDFFVDYDKSIN